MCTSPVVAEGAAEPDANIRCESSHLQLLLLMNNTAKCITGAITSKVIIRRTNKSVYSYYKNQKWMLMRSWRGLGGKAGAASAWTLLRSVFSRLLLATRSSGGVAASFAICISNLTLCVSRHVYTSLACPPLPHPPTCTW